jgi:excisionase family DNA binding protein
MDRKNTTGASRRKGAKRVNPLPTPAPQRLLLKVSEIALETGLSRSFLYALMDRGDLAYVQIGRTRRCRPEDIAAMIKRNVVSAA